MKYLFDRTKRKNTSKHVTGARHTSTASCPAPIISDMRRCLHRAVFAADVCCVVLSEHAFVVTVVGVDTDRDS